MGQIVYDCPRCRAKNTTLDAHGVAPAPRAYEWQVTWETFVVCRNCGRSSVLILKLGPRVKDPNVDAVKNPVTSNLGLNQFYDVAGYIGLRDHVSTVPPQYLPKPIEAAFNEAATCVATECWNAAGAMFRLCLDMATKERLPSDGAADRPDNKTCRDLGLRLPWLFSHGLLPDDLKGLSSCVRQDGNDGAHDGTLAAVDALDLQDFTVELLQRLYTEPKRLELAQARRNERRSKK